MTAEITTKGVGALIVRFSLAMPVNSKSDKKTTEEVKVWKQLSGDVGDWRDKRFEKDDYLIISKPLSAIRALHYTYTTPYEKGTAILPVALYDKYRDEVELKGAQIVEQARIDWRAAYPGMVEKARNNKNGEFKPGQYHVDRDSGDIDWTSVMDEFKFNVSYSAWPQAEQYVGKIAPELVDVLRQSERQALEASNADVLRRLLEPLRAMADKLADPEAVFRDTLVTNLQEIAEIAPSLNVGDNPANLSLAEQIKAKFSNINPDTLRKSTVYRRETSEQAKALLVTFGSTGRRNLKD